MIQNGAYFIALGEGLNNYYFVTQGAIKDEKKDWGNFVYFIAGIDYVFR